MPLKGILPWKKKMSLFLFCYVQREKEWGMGFVWCISMGVVPNIAGIKDVMIDVGGVGVLEKV